MGILDPAGLNSSSAKAAATRALIERTIGEPQSVVRKGLLGSGLSPVGTSVRSFGSCGSAVTQSDGSQQARMYETRDVIAADCAAPRLVYGNFSSTLTGPAELTGANAITVTASIKTSAGTYDSGTVLWPATFGGSTSVTIQPGETVVSDPIPDLSFIAGTQVYVRTYVSVASAGLKWPICYPLLNGANSEGYATTDLTQTVAGVTNAAVGEGVYAPLGIVASTAAPSVAIVGDSIANGYADTPNYRGFVNAALGTSIGRVSVAMDSDKPSLFAGTSRSRFRHKVLPAARYVVENYGRNDISGGITAANIEISRALIWRRLAALGVKTFACTVTPRSSSTDNWVTVANQTTHSSNGELTLLNQWLRAGAPLDPATKAPVAVGTAGALVAPAYNSSGALVVAGAGAHPLAGVFDVAGTVTSSQDSGLWRAAFTANDGIHPIAAGYAAMASAIPLSVFV